MVVLDTDHMTLYELGTGPGAERLRYRLDALSQEDRASTIISYEEQTRGWLAKVSQARNMVQMISAYKRLHRNLLVYRRIRVIEFDETAATIVQRLKQSRLRIGTMDLKIAAIALAHDATLPTCNTSDLSKVPGLKFEDWSA